MASATRTGCNCTARGAQITRHIFMERMTESLVGVIPHSACTSSRPEGMSSKSLGKSCQARKIAALPYVVVHLVEIQHFLFLREQQIMNHMGRNSNCFPVNLPNGQGCDRYNSFVSPNLIDPKMLVSLALPDTKIQST